MSRILPKTSPWSLAALLPTLFLFHHFTCSVQLFLFQLHCRAGMAFLPCACHWACVKEENEVLFCWPFRCKWNGCPVSLHIKCCRSAVCINLCGATLWDAIICSYRWQAELFWTWEEWTTTQKSIPTSTLLAFPFGEYRLCGFWKDLLVLTASRIWR